MHEGKKWGNGNFLSKMNKSHAGKQYAIYTGWGADQRWIQVFNSQAESYGGWAESGTFGDLASDWEGKIRINLPKWSLLIFMLQ